MKKLGLAVSVVLMSVIIAHGGGDISQKEAIAKIQKGLAFQKWAGKVTIEDVDNDGILDFKIILLRQTEKIKFPPGASESYKNGVTEVFLNSLRWQIFEDVAKISSNAIWKSDKVILILNFPFGKYPAGSEWQTTTADSIRCSDIEAKLDEAKSDKYNFAIQHAVVKCVKEIWKQTK